MKKNNRKGFTTVELVIVIAVIAILATVLIPTFSTLITKANASAALQEAKNAYTELLIADDDANLTIKDVVDGYIEVNGYWFEINDGGLTALAQEPTFDKWEAKPNATATKQTGYLKTTIAGYDAVAYLYAEVAANG